ncbi:hypothetical protein A4U64_26760 (plasmid) [Rhodococcus sp. WB1]|uniref:AAA family ATPase n=1 Tax=Rhodococcus sp. WB1 TaxID=1033922 RepID=UPI00081A7427|nr:AAA family ATPase [Rhodococcus sp. WB1]ANZ28495.1 hypothetical protein A4U64_26760 [Rhodococcus sp. WB1]
MTGPGLLEALRRLDTLLLAAVDAAAEAFGPDAATDPYRGLVIGPDEIERLLRREPGEPVLATDPPEGPHGQVLEWLAADFGLVPLDLDLLVLAAAPEIDLRYERLCGYLQDDVSKRRPTLDLALHLLCTNAEARIAARTRVAPDAPLRRHELLHLVADPAQPHQPLLARSLEVDGQVLRLFIGESTLDPRLADCAHVVDTAEVGRPVADLPLPPQTLATLPHLGEGGSIVDPPPRLYLHGPADCGQLATAVALAGAFGCPLLVVDLARAAQTEAPIAETVRVAFREAWFRGTAIFLKQLDEVPGDVRDRLRSALTSELAHSRVLTVVAGRDAWVPATAEGLPPAGVVTVSFPAPMAPIRLRSWKDALAGAGLTADDDVVGSLAGLYRLTEPQIREAVATMRHRADWTGITELAGPYDAALRIQAGHELSRLARKIEHAHTRDALVLPDDTAAQLSEIVGRVRQRQRVLGEWGFEQLLPLGSGTCALFAGPSGTGKTMAADVIAGELGLDLYAIDLATVVSKYIGETEKNLHRIFEAAEAANAVLFFDEADAIFGKRSEVRDAHDRYANIEIAYLLQKMEKYEGVAILATNLRENLDAAFLRRLHFVVEFPIPDEAHRARMWRKFIPPQAPVDEIDYDFLARQFRLAGGNIKNIVVSAAYLASANGGRIGMPHLIRATWREHRKTGRVLSPGDVGPYASVLGWSD